MQEGDAESVVGCCGLGWLFRSKSNFQSASVPAKGHEARSVRPLAIVTKIRKIRSRVLAQKRQVAGILVSGGATVWRLLHAGSSKRAADTHADAAPAAFSAQEKRSFLENSLRARQLMLQGLEDGQLPPSPRYLLTLGLLSGMIWGGVVSEFFSIFLQAILPTDRTKRLTFLEGLRERGLIE